MIHSEKFPLGEIKSEKILIGGTPVSNHPRLSRIDSERIAESSNDNGRKIFRVKPFLLHHPSQPVQTKALSQRRRGIDSLSAHADLNVDEIRSDAFEIGCDAEARCVGDVQQTAFVRNNVILCHRPSE